MLERHKAAYLHTTDVLTGNDIYKGWTDPQKTAFLSAAVRVAGRHLARAIHGEDQGRFGLFPCVISVVLKDFVVAHHQDPRMPSNADEVCLRQALYQVLCWGQDKAFTEQYHLYFDRGEPFHGYVNHILESKRATRELPDLRRITTSTQADMRTVPALQLADLFAWCVSHRRSEVKATWHEKLLRMDRRDEFLDESQWGKLALPQQEIWKSWNIPRRSKTK